MCVTPITLRRNTPDQLLVGCGRCMPCHMKYCNQWAFRMNIHYNQNFIAHCVTLTYDQKHLPRVYDKKSKKAYMTLTKIHPQQFFKKLRQNHTRKFGKKAPKLSYFLCGEYGGELNRPHYHAIIFNAHPDQILQSWQHGSVYFGDNNIDATLKYTLKYSLKSRIYQLNHKNRPYIRPFMLCSQGIGSSIINGNPKQVLPEEVQLGKLNMPLPRYYTKKLGMDIDTTKYQEAAIKKGRLLEQILIKQKMTPQAWKKIYSNYIWRLNKEQMFDNEIMKDMPKPILETLTKHYWTLTKKSKNLKFQLSRPPLIGYIKTTKTAQKRLKRAANTIPNKANYFESLTE